MTEPRRWLRMPGRIWEHFGARAQKELDAGGDEDLCDALSRPRLKRRGLGFTVYVALTLEQVGRLSYWISDSDQKWLRDYRDEMRASIEKTRAAAE